jgi:hypothetical protein
MRCVNLTKDQKCAVWGSPAYPAVCRGFKPGPDVCGKDREQALGLLAAMERSTRPGS